ncbi:MAG TPA: hypothetical protein VET86_11440, partial [Casimicrobiaceae bacterium]|nr:hypothetical protein [Casimicrobiaceae bacterium]
MHAHFTTVDDGPPARAAADGASPDDRDARRRCERALVLLHTHRGDPRAEIEAVLAAAPACVPAHCLRAAHIVGNAESGAHEALA